jgi:predicted enzyme related to lactoylglutathione lyase
VTRIKTNNVAHFAIHADDLERAQEFYAKVFGWQYEGFGGGPMTDFCKVTTMDGNDMAPIGAMQSRKFNAAPEKVIGYECSVAVNDVDITAQKVEAAGGKILMPKTAIPGVGWLIKFLDTEGNLACAVKFDTSAK